MKCPKHESLSLVCDDCEEIAKKESLLARSLFGLSPGPLPLVLTIYPHNMTKEQWFHALAKAAMNSCLKSLTYQEVVEVAQGIRVGKFIVGCSYKIATAMLREGDKAWKAFVEEEDG